MTGFDKAQCERFFNHKKYFSITNVSNVDVIGMMFAFLKIYILSQQQRTKHER